MHHISDLVPLKAGEPITGLTCAALRRAIKDGRLTGYQPGGPGGKLFVSQADLEELMQPVEVQK